jgi:hypothetical protein
LELKTNQVNNLDIKQIKVRNSYFKTIVNKFLKFIFNKNKTEVMKMEKKEIKNFNKRINANRAEYNNMLRIYTFTR